VGKPFCPNCHIPIAGQTIDQMREIVFSYPEGTKITLMAPVLQGKKGEGKRFFDLARSQGYQRVRVDGEMINLEDLKEDMRLDKQVKHTIDIVVDRVKVASSSRKRIAESLEICLKQAEGYVRVLAEPEGGESQEHLLSQMNSCVNCGFTFTEIEPRLFSFNNPYGACPACNGLGTTLEPVLDRILIDPNLSYWDGGLAFYSPTGTVGPSVMKSLASALGFDLKKPFKDWPDSHMDKLLYGTGDELHIILYENKEGSGFFKSSRPWPGLLGELKRRYHDTTSDSAREYYLRFMDFKHCSACDGRRLNPSALSVLIEGKNIYEISSLSVESSLSFFKELPLSEKEKVIAEEIFKEIHSRLFFLDNVGLGYLNMGRLAGTLSGGESQRIRLATQIGSSLVGVLYVLDEPTIGLHERDNERLIKTLINLRELGNTLIVVEHDERTLRAADYIVEIGPGSGIHGGHITFEGTFSQMLESKDSLTGDYLSGRRGIQIPTARRAGNGEHLLIKGAREHNLKNVDIQIPLGLFTVFTGVSGSGKSSLLNGILSPALHNHLLPKSDPVPVGDHDSIEGFHHIDRVIQIDQKPIGRTPKSNPATYIEVFTEIRNLFTSLPESKARGYKAGRFSFNVKGGRCENCQGEGILKIEMHFLSDVFVTCDVCGGKRFNEETLSVLYKGQSIYDVLEMSVEEAHELFSAHPKIANKLSVLISVGLDYIKLGQSSLMLSGGEAQRIKLAFELSKRSTGKTLYIIDEPTTGLHFADIELLLEVLHKFVEKGNSVVLIEHNMDVIKQADWIIDLGPEGGDRGGEVVATGTPEAIAQCGASYTGQFLKDYLKG
jgi:excinuclease ABC subunit A